MMKKILFSLALLLASTMAAVAGASSSGLPIVGLPVLNGVPGQILSESLGGALVAGAVTPAANASGLVVSGYSLTGTNAQSLFDLSGTWNTTGTPTALKVNITDTASNAASKLLDLQIGGASRLSFTKSGIITLSNGTFSPTITATTLNGNWLELGNSAGVGIVFGGGGNGSIGLPSPATIGWTSISTTYSTTKDLLIQRDAAGILAQRNGVSAQTLRVYNTFTDLSNYERIGLDWQTTANVAIIGMQAAGTGTLRPVQFTGAGFTFGSAPAAVVAGEIASPKITASGSAPGAGFGKMEWVAGTTGGSCKLIAYAGTSTTPVTIVDNVGSGC